MNEEKTVLGLDELEIENTSIEEIDSEEVHLVCVAVDASGSMSPYVEDMKKCLADFKGALTASKEENKILLARATFSDITDISGYKPIKDFDGSYSAAGGTTLYDVIVESATKLTEYMDHLKSQGMRCRAVIAVFSDGEDTCSRKSAAKARQAIEALNNKEITTAFVSFGGEADTVAKDLGFKNLLTVQSSAHDLRIAFNCLSKSVIENSKAVTPSQDAFFV
jgi:uncharacterized protein with von Willebrand factor type A (vWA) domain